MESKVSVIVPVYNGEKYIKKCVDMLTTQTIDSYEVIIVNDGSTDSTDQIIQKILVGNNRIKYIPLKKNKGVSAARNVGIDNAEGDYITFVDVDDDVSEDFLEQIQKAINNKNKYDVICFARSYAVDGKSMEESDIVKLLSTTLGGNYIKDKEDYLLTAVWSKAFNTEYLKRRKIKFTSGITFGEDVLFMCDIFSDACRTLFVHKGFYSYIQNPDSVTQSGYNENDQYQLRKVLSVFNKLEAKYPAVWSDSIVQYWKTCFILNYGLLVIGRVARSSAHNNLLNRRKLIRQQTALLDIDTNPLQNSSKKKQSNIDTTLRKIRFIKKYPTLYLFKVTMQSKLDGITKR